jgi:hypothetical protein
MKTTVVFESKQLERELKRIQKSMPAVIDRALIQTAQFGTNLILDRTADGQGYKGGSFASYSAKYALFRKIKGRQVAPVDLNFSGKMLGAMASAKVKTGVAKIYFTRAAEAKKAAFNNQKRPFFGFNRNEQSRVQEFFASRIKV